MRVSNVMWFLLFLLTQIAGANILIVPDEYITISSACNAATVGDTVGITAGGYLTKSHIPAGVTVLGLGSDSTQVSIGPSDIYSAVFVADSGDDPIVIENVSIVNLDGNIVIANYNCDLLVQRCHLKSLTEGMYIPNLIFSRCNLKVSKCHIKVMGDFPVLIHMHGPHYALIEDCVIDEPNHSTCFCEGDAGATIEYRNNTFMTGVSCECFSPSCDFTLLAVNNIISGLDHGAWPEGCIQNVELRYNDFRGELPPPEIGYQIGNFSANPLFCDSSWPYTDVRLEPESPCLRAGEDGEDVGARLGVCWPYADVSDQDRDHIEQMTVSAPFPNPSLGKVSISAYLSAASFVRLEVFDMTGRVVWSHAPEIRRGEFSYNWDGMFADGSLVASGTYYFRLSSGDEVVTKPVCIIR